MIRADADLVTGVFPRGRSRVVQRVLSGGLERAGFQPLPASERVQSDDDLDRDGRRHDRQGPDRILVGLRTHDPFHGAAAGGSDFEISVAFDGDIMSGFMQTVGKRFALRNGRRIV